MATKGSKKIPLVVQARATLNACVRMEQTVNRSLAALACYASEGQNRRIREESRYLRGRMDRDIPEIRDLIQCIIRDIQYEEQEKKTLLQENATLKKTVNEMEEEQVSMSQAMDMVEFDVELSQQSLDLAESQESAAAADDDKPE